MTADAATENDEARRQAAIAGYLDQDPAAARSWRGHQWMVSAASGDQMVSAVNVACRALSEARNHHEWLLAQFEEHNRARAIVEMPAATLEEFENVLWAFYMHFELLDLFANGVAH